MRDVPLLKDSSGRFLTVSNFFSPFVSIFKHMETTFPPPPYNDQQWMLFLEKIGLITKVTGSHLLKYAKSIERDSCSASSEKDFRTLELLRKAVCSEIKNENNFHAVDKIAGELKEIKFTTTNPIPKHLSILYEERPRNTMACLNQSACSRNMDILFAQFPNSTPLCNL